MEKLALQLNLEADTIQGTLNVSEERANELLDSVRHAFTELPDQFRRDQFLAKTLEAAETVEEAIFIAMYVQFLVDRA